MARKNRKLAITGVDALGKRQLLGAIGRPRYPSESIGSRAGLTLVALPFSIAPIAALSARGSLATVFTVAILGTMTLGHRRPPGRTALLTIAALVTVGLGCGSQETSDPVATTLPESESTPDRPLPAPGKAYVEYSNGRVTVRSNGALQLAILEQLAAQAGFEVVAGKAETQPITLAIDRVSLVVAIASILDGFSYTVGYDFDQASGTRILTRVEIDKAIDSGALKISDRESNAAIRSAEEARGDRKEPTSEVYATEQAELIAELDSPDPEARTDAVDWIDLDGEALERLISLLESDPDAEVRAAIVDRLGEEESPAAMAALINALRDPNSEVVLRAIEILEFEAEAWLIPELERLLTHPDPEVREAAQDAIDFLTE